MSSNSKEIAKLKKKYSKWPGDGGFSGLKKKILMLLPAWCVIILLNRVLNLSEYRLKRESIKFFQMSNRAYGAKKLRRCDRLLCISLELLGSNLPNSYKVLLRNSVVLTLDNQFERRALSNSVLIATKELEPSLLDATCWYQLSRGLFSIGYFRAAWCARENSLDISILEGKANMATPNALYRALQADLERTEIADAESLLIRSQKTLSTKRFRDISDYLKLMNKTFTQQNVDILRQSENSREVFHGLIAGRSVSLVGPGNPHGNYGKLIDEADTVIRIKYADERMLDRDYFHGSRTDISFIGAVESVASNQHLGFSFHENLKLILSTSTSRQFVGTTPVCVVASEVELYRTPATSGIRTLLEVLKNSPSKLAIYGFDFYSTLTPYSKEMSDFYEVESWRFGHPNDFVSNGVYFKFARARDFSEHDPVSNFCFAQNLYKAGLFDIEPYGKSILELTPYQYVERLEEMLGDW